MKRHLKIAALVILVTVGLVLVKLYTMDTPRLNPSSSIPLFTPTPIPPPPFLVAGRIETCQELTEKNSYSPKFWIYNPRNSNLKLLVDGYEIKISKDAQYPEEDGSKCVLGGDIEPWGEGAVQVALNSYGGPGLVEIKRESGKTISYQLSGEWETLLINLSPNHSVEWEIHRYSTLQFGGGSGPSERIRGLGFSKVPNHSEGVIKFGEPVPDSVTMVVRRGQTFSSTSRLGLSARPIGRRSSAR